MKEELFKFLFGNDKQVPNNIPDALFSEEWQGKEDKLRYRVAKLIADMIPDNCLKAGNRFDLERQIRDHIFWSHPEIVSVLEERAPKPLRTESEFIHFLCEYILTKGGVR